MQALSPGGSTRLDAATLEAIAGEAPSASKPRSEVLGCVLADLLAALGMQPSKSAARRLIKVRSGVRALMGLRVHENPELSRSLCLEERAAGAPAGPLQGLTAVQPKCAKTASTLCAPFCRRAWPACMRKAGFWGDSRLCSQGGGVRINNDKVEDEGRVLAEQDLLDGRLCLLATGKKNKLLLRIQ